MASDSSPSSAQRTTRLRSLTGPIAAAAILLATGLGLWMGRKGERPQVKIPVAPAPASVAPPPVAGSNEPMSAVAPQAPPNPVDEPVSEAEQQRIYDWLTESDTPEAAAESMLASWKELSPAGKLAVSRHLVNLVADEKYESLAGLLLDGTNSAEVKEVIFGDVLNRADEVKWPTLLRVLEQEDNPMSGEARRILGFVLGEDYKDDWAKWQAQVQSELIKPAESSQPPPPLPPR